MIVIIVHRTAVKLDNKNLGNLAEKKNVKLFFGFRKTFFPGKPKNSFFRKPLIVRRRSTQGALRDRVFIRSNSMLIPSSSVIAVAFDHQPS